MLRLFVAVDLPALQQQTASALHTELRGARWAKTHQLHITLRFMGDTPEEALPAIRDQLARVESPSFELGLRGVGVFPPGARRPRVLWLGLSPAEPLLALERKVDEVLKAVIPPTSERQRAFSPHLTLARLDGKPDDDLPRFLARQADFQGPAWQVHEFRLYKSTLHPSGAVHEALGTYPLASIRR